MGPEARDQRRSQRASTTVVSPTNSGRNQRPSSGVLVREEFGEFGLGEEAFHRREGERESDRGSHGGRENEARERGVFWVLSDRFNCKQLQDEVDAYGFHKYDCDQWRMVQACLG